MGTNTVVRGLTISPPTGTVGLTASGAGGLTVGQVAVATTSAAAVNLVNSDGAFSFSRIDANGGSNGIVWNNTTAATGSFTVVGSGTACNSAANCTGGAIQTTSGAGIVLNNTHDTSFDRMFIGNPGGSGVDGRAVTNFTFTNGTVVNAGTAGTAGTFESALGFNASPGTNTNISGTLTVTGNTFTNPHYSGLDVQSSGGTVTNANVSTNTITTPGFSGINFVGTGSIGGVFSVNGATIDQNNISGSAKNGVQVSMGNSSAGTGATAGIIGGTAINITNNTITALQATGTQAITFALGGGNSGSRGQANFLIKCNGRNTGGCLAPTNAPLGSSQDGTVLLIGNNDFATMVGTIDSNTIVATHRPNVAGGNGIGGGNGTLTNVAAVTPNLTLTVTGNAISGTDGNGILLVGRATSGTANLKIASNSVQAPVNATGSAREGIRVDAGNAVVGSSDSVCLNMTGNTSFGSNGASGLGVRKQGTDPLVNNFGIHNITQNPPSNTDVVNFLNAQNPLGNGTDIISGSSYTRCTTAPN
jgi:hypothetical protein